MLTVLTFSVLLGKEALAPLLCVTGRRHVHNVGLHSRLDCSVKLPPSTISTQVGTICLFYMVKIWM